MKGILERALRQVDMKEFVASVMATQDVGLILTFLEKHGPPKMWRR